MTLLVLIAAGVWVAVALVVAVAVGRAFGSGSAAGKTGDRGADLSPGAPTPARAGSYGPGRRRAGDRPALRFARR